MALELNPENPQASNNVKFEFGSFYLNGVIDALVLLLAFLAYPAFLARH
jgi:hypothetical protein